MINATHKNVHFLNQVNGGITRIGLIDPETINNSDLCYHYYKRGPDFLWGKLRIKDLYAEPHFPERIELISSQIQMNTLFKTNY